MRLLRRALALRRLQKKGWRQVKHPPPIPTLKRGRGGARRSEDEIKRWSKMRRHATAEYVRWCKDKPCTDCGQSYPSYVMQFDHRDPALKYFGLAEAGLHSREVVDAEIAKCDLVCANCHAERTHRQRVAKRVTKTVTETVTETVTTYELWPDT